MANEDQNGGADITFKALGTETNVRNVKSLNTALTAATLVVALFVGYLVFAHAGDQKEAGANIVRAIKDTSAETAAKLERSNAALADALRELSSRAKEQTRATREQNCLLLFSQEERKHQEATCKRLAQ